LKAGVILLFFASGIHTDLKTIPEED
jgi:hypothetical protein